MIIVIITNIIIFTSNARLLMTQSLVNHGHWWYESLVTGSLPATSPPGVAGLLPTVIFPVPLLVKIDLRSLVGIVDLNWSLRWENHTLTEFPLTSWFIYVNIVDLFGFCTMNWAPVVAPHCGHQVLHHPQQLCGRWIMCDWTALSRCLGSEGAAGVEGLYLPHIQAPTDDHENGYCNGQ